MNPDRTFALAEAKFLADLASGKYDAQVARIRKYLKMVSSAVPMLVGADAAFGLLLKLNQLTAPGGPVVPDGAGGAVPESNSRYDPRTGRFI